MKIMIDPYLSNSVEEKMGNAFQRQIPIDPTYLLIDIDVLVLTHAHGDHTDYKTLDCLLHKEKSIVVICTSSNYLELKRRYGEHHNYVRMEPDICVTIGETSFFAVKAYHTDPSSIGIIIEDSNKRIYHTGDTLYAPNAVSSLLFQVDYLLCPINGWGGNMNCQDAYKFVKQLNPKYVFPMHWDMFLPPWGENIEDFKKLFTDYEQEQICILEHYREHDLPD